VLRLPRALRERALALLLWLPVAALGCERAPAAPIVPAASVRPAAPTVVMLSLDGTTPELALREMATLREIARRGAVADRMLPAFPTNTFPNHVTLVTGVAPERHGIVDNAFVDPVRGRYERDADPTWLEVEPLWSLLEGRGIPTAAYHWVGSEGPWRSGRGPRFWKPFDADVGEREKVEQVLAWLADGPADARPRLVTVWMHGADRAGHRHGPGAPELGEALREQDAALAALVAALDRDGAFETLTLVVVSDHGMDAVRERVDLAGALRRAGLRAEVVGGGGFAKLAVEGGDAAVARAVAVARGLGLEAWPRGEAPPELLLANARFGDAVVLAPPGVAIGRLPLRGAHGYSPDHPTMGALFAAMGRGVPAGVVLAGVRSLDVAPTLLALLGEPVPEWMQGRAIPGLGADASAKETR
jgi:predicted AlkP superfamily pyrophosphatase or phosphodiesterase